MATPCHAPMIKEMTVETNHEEKIVLDWGPSRKGWVSSDESDDNVEAEAPPFERSFTCLEANVADISIFSIPCVSASTPLGISRDTLLDDGFLDVTLLKTSDRPRIVKYLKSVVGGSKPPSSFPFLETHRVTELHIRVSSTSTEDLKMKSRSKSLWTLTSDEEKPPLYGVECMAVFDGVSRGGPKTRKLNSPLASLTAGQGFVAHKANFVFQLLKLRPVGALSQASQVLAACRA
jgi:hypothetical protein